MDSDHTLKTSPVCIEPPPKPPPSKSLEGMNPIHDNLPQIPFFACIIGPRHSGKTVLLYNLLSQKEGMYGHAFRPNNIIFYSPTKDKDPTLQPLKMKNVYGPPTDPQWLVDSIFSKQKAYQEADNMTAVLLVFDDITQCRAAWKPIEHLSYFGRHDHIHVLYVAHKMSAIPRGVRTQTQQWIIYKPHEESERQWIMEMFSRSRTWKVWEAAMTRAWNIPYNFIYIDFERKEEECIYRSGFNDPLFTPEELAFLHGEAEEDGLESIAVMNDVKEIQDVESSKKKRKYKNVGSKPKDKNKPF